MKFSDITGQDVTTLTEAPMGFMNTLGTAVKAINPFSLSGRNKAQGQFKTGVSANQIYAQYYNWLGQTGSPADTDTVLAFLQQNGYGEQAITAAQSKFPKVPQQPATDTTSTASAATTATSSTPATAANPNYSGGTTPAPAPTKVNYSGMPKPKPLPKATSGQGAYSAKNPYATSAASKPAGPTQAELDADHERMASGANENRRIRESHRKLREAIALNKQQLSAIFTAVAQSGAVPQQSTSTGSDGNSVGTGTTQDSGGDDTSANGQQATDQQSRNSGRFSQLPNRLTPDDILQYYARLTSPYERDQVKKGIPEVDKQLNQATQQTRQQPNK